MDACLSKDPVNEPGWLKTMKDSLVNCSCQVSILQGTYNNQTVFFTLMNDPRCDGVFGTSLYDCDGNMVRTFGKDDYQAYEADVKIDTTLYVCKN